METEGKQKGWRVNHAKQWTLGMDITWIYSKCREEKHKSTEYIITVVGLGVYLQ